MECNLGYCTGQNVVNQGSRLNGARRYKLRHNDDPSQKYGKKQQQHMEHHWNLVMRGNNGRWRNTQDNRHWKTLLGFRNVACKFCIYQDVRQII